MNRDALRAAIGQAEIIHQVSLAGIDLSGADLSGAIFEACDFTGANRAHALTAPRARYEAMATV